MSLGRSSSVTLRDEGKESKWTVLQNGDNLSFSILILSNMHISVNNFPIFPSTFEYKDCKLTHARVVLKYNNDQLICDLTDERFIWQFSKKQFYKLSCRVVW